MDAIARVEFSGEFGATVYRQGLPWVWFNEEDSDCARIHALEWCWARGIDYTITWAA